MTTTIEPTPAIAVRTCVAILRGDKICLIHRRRPGGDQYSLPGGLLHPDEEASAALARELMKNSTWTSPVSPTDPNYAGCRTRRPRGPAEPHRQRGRAP
ncbi:NUDIX hydrolase [Streptomyces sp. NPDC059460]|uniref:NUDIX hydrolase n=1 Tax=Streptomyces sp. NPDC059460 TaxID=3346840 RepID=UPI0036BC84B8